MYLFINLLNIDSDELYFVRVSVYQIVPANQNMIFLSLIQEELKNSADAARRFEIVGGVCACVRVCVRVCVCVCVCVRVCVFVCV